MPQRVLMTGHNGFIGSVMAPHLQARGHVVVGLDSGFFRGCTLGEASSGIACVWRDIRDVNTDYLKGFDAVIHLAGLSRDPQSTLDPALISEINHKAAVRLARHAKQAGVGRFIVASSCRAYGAASGESVDEDSALRPQTPYDESKARTEEDISRMADAGFSPVFMRLASVYGLSSRLRADAGLNNTICWAATTGVVPISGDASQWSPIVHVEDAANAFAAALEAPSECIHNHAFNVGSNRENYQSREIAEIVMETVEGSKIETRKENRGDGLGYRVSFDKIGRLLPGFAPRWTAQLGAVEVHRALTSHGITLEAFQGRRFMRLKQLRYLLDCAELRSDLRWKRNMGEEMATWAA